MARRRRTAMVRSTNVPLTSASTLNSILQVVTLVTEIVTNADLYWEVATQSHSDWGVWTSFTQHKKQGGIGHDESGLVIHRSTMRFVYAYRN